MAGSVKLRGGVRPLGQGPLWAEFASFQIDIGSFPELRNWSLQLVPVSLRTVMRSVSACRQKTI